MNRYRIPREAKNYRLDGKEPSLDLRKDGIRLSRTSRPSTCECGEEEHSAQPIYSSSSRGAAYFSVHEHSISQFIFLCLRYTYQVSFTNIPEDHWEWRKVHFMDYIVSMN